MDLLNHGNRCPIEGGVAAVGCGDMMITKEPVSGWQARRRDESLSARVDRDVRRQHGSDGCEILIGKGFRGDGPRWRWGRSGGVGYRCRKRDWLPDHYGSDIGFT